MTTPPPPFTISFERADLRIRPSTPDDTVADLALALGCRHLAMGDRVLRPDDRLDAAGLVVGSEVAAVDTLDDDSVPRSDESDSPVEVAVLTGPSCQPWRSLGPGRYSIGRSPTAAILLDDPTVELHHAFLDVATDGTTSVTQLSGRVPIRAATGVPPAASFVVGASRIEVRAAGANREPDGTTGSVVRADHDPWRRVVRRAPQPVAAPVADPIAAPQPPAHDASPPALGLIGVAAAAAGAALMAVVFGQALFALMAFVGAFASVITWFAGVLATRRRRSRAHATFERENDEFLDALEQSHAAEDLAHRARHHDAVDAIAAGQCSVWRRRTGHAPVTVTLGRGVVRSTAAIDDAQRGRLRPDQLVAVERCERLVDVGVPMTISPGSIVGVRGDSATVGALGRSILTQLAAMYGPADLRLTVVTEHADRWRWANWLPHGGPDRSPIVVASPAASDGALDVDSPADGLSVIVTDAPDLLTSRTGPLRRALDASRAACIVLVPGERTVPSVCERVLEVGRSGCGRWGDGASLDDDAIALAGISVTAAEQVARRLAPLIDPEDRGGVAALPRALALSDLDTPADADSIVQRWRANTADTGLAATIGMSHDGTVAVDLVRDGPHALIAGTTGSGKSELLRTLVVSLAASVGPDHLSFVLIDFKGGATFDACSTLPHTVGVVTDLDEGLAERALIGLDAELRRRELRFRRDGVDNITDARRSCEPLPRLVVIVDEFATLAKELPGFLDALVSIAQRGRSLGIHLVLATQRPAGVITDDIRANTNLRLALRVHDRGDALDVVGDERPARFPAGLAGRALMRLGPDDVVVFQTASCTTPSRVDPGRLVVEHPECGDAPGDASPLIDVLVDAIGSAARTVGVAPPHRPWTDPLPEVLSAVDVEFGSGMIGVIDEPAAQRRLPLRWDRSRGNLLLVGAVGTGTTTAAHAIAWALVHSTMPAECHVYVVDGHGEPCYDGLASDAHCGGVVRTVESERLDRLLRRVEAELDRRTDSGDRLYEIVLIVDGLGPLRTALASIERTESALRLDRILREGPTCGVVTCATLGESDPYAVIVGERWEFQAPGRVRIAGSGLTAQIVADVPTTPDAGVFDGSGDGPPPILALPEVVTPAEVEPWESAPEERAAIDAGSASATGERSDGHRGSGTRLCAVDRAAATRPGALVVGLGADDLAPAMLDIADGDHVLIAGAAGTGCSTALRQLAHDWSVRHPDGVVVRAGRNEPLDQRRLEETAASTTPALVAIDDADRVADPGGALAAIIADRRPGLVVIAAARLEAVRSAYGHWTREVARSRCGLIMTSTGEVDGDLLGASLPRRTMIPPRPGLAWAIDTRGHRLVQVAARMPP